jgi:uncharacterized protein YxjI
VLDFAFFDSQIREAPGSILMRVQCSCGKSLNVADKLAGKRIRCPACSAVLTVAEESAPAAEEVEAPPAPPQKRQATEEGGAEAPRPAKKQAIAEEDEEVEVAPPANKKQPAAEEEEDEAPAPKKKRAAAGTSTLAGNQFVVKEQKQLFSGKKAYEIVDAASGEVVASATQKVSTMAMLLGMVMGKDNMSLTIEIRTKPDDELLFAVRRSGLFFKKVEALDADGKVLGSYKAKAFSLSGGFHIYDNKGKHFAEIRGKMFKSDYKFLAPDGETEMGTVSKTWGGLAKALLTGAQTYVVTIAPDYGDDSTAKIRMLGAAIAIDAMFAKASGGGGGGITSVAEE